MTGEWQDHARLRGFGQLGNAHCLLHLSLVRLTEVTGAITISHERVTLGLRDTGVDVLKLRPSPLVLRKIL